MKKIINNRVYDTSTAKRCSDPVDIGSIEEYDFYALTLYQKRNGEFFLFRDVFRGPLDDGIVPLSYEDARQWAESNVSANKYEELFGTVSEDDSRAAINLSLPSPKKRRGAFRPPSRGAPPGHHSILPPPPGPASTPAVSRPHRISASAPMSRRCSQMHSRRTEK